MNIYKTENAKIRDSSILGGFDLPLLIEMNSSER